MIKQRRTLLRFFCTYFCVLLPLLGISLLVTQNAMARLKEKEEAAFQKQLYSIAMEFEVSYQNYRQKSIALFNNVDLSAPMMFSDSGNEAKALNLIKNIKLFDGTTDDIFVYYGTGDLYSSQGLTSPSVYFAMTLNCTDESSERAIQAVSTDTHSVTVLYQKGSNGYLLYRFPVQAYQNNYSPSMQAVVSFSQIAKILEPYLSEQEVLVRVNIGGNSVYFRNSESKCGLLSQSEYDQFYKQEASAMIEERLSFAPNASLQLLYDENIYYQDFRNFQSISMILLIIGLLISTLMSFFFSHHRWERVKQFFYNAKGSGRSQNIPNSLLKDEFDYIQTLFNESIRENNLVEQNAKVYQKTMVQQTATLIFHGLLQEPQAIQYILKTCGFELFEEYYFLCGVMLNNADDSVIKHFEQLLAGDLHCTIPLRTSNAILFLSELPTTDYTKCKRMEMANHIRNVLVSIGIENYQIALSQVYQQLSIANFAYLEVVSILEQMQKSNTENVIECWDNWIQTNDTYVVQLQQNQFDQFTEALVSKDASGAKQIFNNMLRYIAVTPTSSENKQYLRFCILRALILVVRNSENPYDQTLMTYFTHVNPANEEQFQERIIEVISNYCKHEVKRIDFSKVITYIENNFSRYDLSLEELAAYIGISKTQMSKLFKAKTGICYIDYLTNLRMQKARGLVEQTDMSIKDIFTAVGYVDKTNFSKKFKTYYGVNASELRKQTRSEHDLSEGSKNIEEEL